MKFKGYIYLIITIFLFSCANKGQGPTGGKKDEIPPRVVKEQPANGSLRFDKKKIHIQFDENISLEKLNENVIISPPQVRPPAINAYGKNLYIEFSDTLQANTTYSIDFGNAIVDLNEKNPLKNFVFAFATGDHIDTLKVSGNLLNASDLNPVSGVLVGIYNATRTDDSLFMTKPFLRIGRTDENGHFSINNMKEGNYKMYALSDVSNDFHYNAGETLAMYDSIVTPIVQSRVFADTIWKDTVTVDTILQRNGFLYLPDNLELLYFKENLKRQYFVKTERKTPTNFTLFFNAKSDLLPEVKPLNFNWENKHIVQKNNTLDTLTYWITDSTVWKNDTLKMQMTYFKTDSTFSLVPQTDTISAIYRRPRREIKDKNANVLNIKTNLTQIFDIYKPITVRFEEPLQNIDLEKVKLKEKIDTIFKPLRYEWQPIDSTKMNFNIIYKWESEKSYQLEIDSASFISIYNKANNKLNTNFKIRSREEYASIKAIINPFDSAVVLQVLDAKDIVIASKPAEISGVLFEYLKPGDYYLRMFVDENGNGVWDTGSLSPRRQPEKVFYYNKKLTLMANWEFEETWEKWGSEPLTKQKPKELQKDASKTK
ncbi:MAG: Ig-like domain-containing domain [Paludibacter sp.]|nr:Ig-like domain-containing domain [Paludibacter sp.]